MTGKALAIFGAVVKVFAGSLAAVSAVGAAVWWLVQPRVEVWIAQIAAGAVQQAVDDAIARAALDGRLEASGGPCAIIPIAGHFIEGARPGQWGNVKWREVERLRDDCGVPVVTGLIVNGSGFLHDAPLSISGVPVEAGFHDFPYRFFINEGVTSGRARFRVIVTYPDASGGAPPAISPWLDFTILESPQ